MKVKCATLSLAVLVATGCTIHEAEPTSAAEVTSAPAPAYARYPHTVYEGRTVYYVDGRWGYPDRGGWVFYREEPSQLMRYRTTVIEAPPAPRVR